MKSLYFLSSCFHSRLMKTLPSLSSEHVDNNPTYVNLTNSCCNIDAYFAIKSLTRNNTLYLGTLFSQLVNDFFIPSVFVVKVDRSWTIKETTINDWMAGISIRGIFPFAFIYFIVISKWCLFIYRHFLTINKHLFETPLNFMCTACQAQKIENTKVAY